MQTPGEIPKLSTGAPKCNTNKQNPEHYDSFTVPGGSDHRNLLKPIDLHGISSSFVPEWSNISCAAADEQ
jgi:hypothetical protein